MFPTCRKYPKDIMVRGTHWDIKFCRSTPEGPDSDLGLNDPEARIIFIRYKQTPRETFMTLVHEWLHAVEAEYEIQIGHPIIEVLEEVFASFCEENDEFLIWFIFTFLEGQTKPR